MRSIMIIVVIGFCFRLSLAEIIEVPADFTTIQAAIEAAAVGDTVLVDDGQYPENINFRGKDIVVASRLIEDGDFAHVNETEICGNQPLHADSASCVLFIGGETAAAALVGFRLSDGTGTKWWDPPTSAWYREGGGILIDSSSPTIQFNVIIFNVAIDTSGGMRSAGGGGIRIGFGAPLILNNVILNNGGRYGGGVVVNYADPIIRNNVIAQNLGGEDFGGAGLWIYGNPHTTLVENNYIIGNLAQLGTGNGASGVGGGMMIWSTTANVRNNIIWGNAALSHWQIRRNGASGIVNYNLVEDGWPGEGNFDAIPDFADYTTLRLLETSPAIDAGDTTEIYNDIGDPENEGVALYPSLGGLRNDLGVYGGPYASLLPRFLVDFFNFAPGNLPIVTSAVLAQNFPNPFNPETTIAFALSSAQYITLRVYDLEGRSVAQLARGLYPAGDHSVTFDGSKHTSGIYFYTLQSGAATMTRKMVLVK